MAGEQTTVKELIEALQGMPPEARLIVTKGEGGDGYFSDWDIRPTPWVDPFGDVRLSICRRDYQAKGSA
jgi:hypothetical protein